MPSGRAGRHEVHHAARGSSSKRWAGTAHVVLHAWDASGKAHKGVLFGTPRRCLPHCSAQWRTGRGRGQRGDCAAWRWACCCACNIPLAAVPKGCRPLLNPAHQRLHIWSRGGPNSWRLRNSCRRLGHGQDGRRDGRWCCGRRNGGRYSRGPWSELDISQVWLELLIPHREDADGIPGQPRQQRHIHLQSRNLPFSAKQLPLGTNNLERGVP